MEKEDLTWLGIAGKDEGLSECDFEELTSHEDFSREQRQLLSRSAERFFNCSAEIRRKYFPAFLSYTQRVLYINSSQLHIIAEEHLLKTTEPPNYIFFADQYGAHQEQQYMMDLITVVEDLNADIISCSGKNKASEFLKKYAFVPVNEFFLKKEQNTHLYFANINKYGRLPFPTEMLKELIAAPEFKKQKNKKPDAHESSKQDNKTGLVLTKNSDSTSCSAHCLSMVQYIYAWWVDSSVVELLIDVLPLVIAPRVIRVYGKYGEVIDAQLTETLVKNIKYTNRLETLILQDINLTAKSAAIISKSLHKVPNLRWLSLAFNPLGEGLNDLINQLSCVPHLEELDLNNVMMTKEQVHDLTTAVRHSNISYLDSEYHDREGNPKPEDEWISEDYWKRRYPSLFPEDDSSSDSDQDQELHPFTSHDTDAQSHPGPSGEHNLPLQRRELQLEVGQEEEDTNKTKIHEGTVTSAGTHWDLKLGAVLVFPPNAVAEPKSIVVYKWKCSACSPPLLEHEAIVSNVIEIATNTGQALQFNVDVKLFLSHSAPDLLGYELVIKEQIDQESNEWEDVDGIEDLRCQQDIEDDYPPLKEISDFPVAQAGITQCSTYAVVCRLRPSPSYTITPHGGSFYHPDYPGVTVIIPKKAVASKTKVSLVLKVQEVPSEGFEGQDVFIGPVLRLICSQVVHFLKPVTVQLPVSFRDEQKEFPDPSTCRVRILYLRSDGEHKKWIEITGDLLKPASFDGKLVRFQVEHFCRFVPIVDLGESISRIIRYLSGLIWNQPTLASFFAYLQSDHFCPQDILQLICCPSHLRKEVKEELEGKTLSEENSAIKMIPGHDKAFVFVAGGIRPAYMDDVNDFHLLLQSNERHTKQLLVCLSSDQSPARVKFYSSPEQAKKNLLSTLNLKLPTRVSEEHAHQEPGTIKDDVVDANDLEGLSLRLGDFWEAVARRLGFIDAEITAFRKENEKYSDKAFSMLEKWRQKNGSEATYRVLYDALCHEFVKRKDLAEEFCTYK